MKKLIFAMISFISINQLAAMDQRVSDRINQTNPHYKITISIKNVPEHLHEGRYTQITHFLNGLTISPKNLFYPIKIKEIKKLCGDQDPKEVEKLIKEQFTCIDHQCIQDILTEGSRVYLCPVLDKTANITVSIKKKKNIVSQMVSKLSFHSHK